MAILSRRGLPLAGASATALPAFDSAWAQAGGTRCTAMTAADMPLPIGQTDRGAEGMRCADEALCLFVAHDVGPRALSPRVKGFVQAQNWYQDATPVTMG
jgi:hypothetical protein